VCVLLAALVATVLGKQLCLQGEAPLAIGPGSPERLWCTEDDCTVRWALTLDTTTVDDQRWALQATVNGTSLSQLFPQLTDVRVQCSTSGEVIATTASGPNAERLRLIWTYSGVSSVSCAYVLSTVDLEADFRNFQALLAYSGHISSFDATFSSQAADYSIGSSEQQCPAPASTATTTGHVHPYAETCSIGACRHGVDVWRVLKEDPTWHAVEADRLCSLSCHDIIMNKGQAAQMPINWRQEAELLCAAKLNSAMYGCHLPVDTEPEIANSQEYLSNPLKCSLNVKRTGIVQALTVWNNHDDVCNFDAASGDAGGEQSVSTENLSREQSYLIWAIVMTVAFVVACMVAIGVLILCWSPIRAYAFALLSGVTSNAQNRLAANAGGAACRLGDEVEMTSFWSSVFGSDDEEYDGTPPTRSVHSQSLQSPAQFAQQPVQEELAKATYSQPPATYLHYTTPVASAPPSVYTSYVPSQYYMSTTGDAPGCSGPTRNVQLSSYADDDATGRK